MSSSVHVGAQSANQYSLVNYGVAFFGKPLAHRVFNIPVKINTFHRRILLEIGFGCDIDT